AWHAGDGGGAAADRSRRGGSERARVHAGSRAPPWRRGSDRGRRGGDYAAHRGARPRGHRGARGGVQVRFRRPGGLLDRKPQPNLETGKISQVVLSLDEGTTGATAIAVGVDGEIRGKGYAEITQHYPRPGWVEHDPGEIWSAVETSARQALDAASAKPSDVAAVGITNQRETLVLW